MNAWRVLVKDNPLLNLVLGSSLRSFRAGAKSAKTAWWLVGGVIFALTLLAGYYAEYVAWQYLLFPLLVIVVLIPLAVLHGSIAGEREKRSIEVLLVAPLTSGQIVAAKLSKGILPVTVSVIAFVPIAAAIEIGHLSSPAMSVPPSSLSVWQVFCISMVLIVASALFSAGLTMFVSSRAKTTAAALIGSLFALLAWIIGTPVLSSAVTGYRGGSNDGLVLLLANPFYTLGRVAVDSGTPASVAVRDALGLSLVLIVLTLALVALAQRSVRDFKGAKHDA